SRSTLKAYTAFTQTDPDAIRRRLDAVRETGYAIAHQETYLGDISVAAAILNGFGRATAALTISTSTLVTTPQFVEENYATLVSAAAASLSQRST
ncbi:MAG: IclR family transcriptional regulator C-terminal domain-containing protein, partial [Aquamicrobium sp.]|nr:IclR family transcriptional regulator C-terminal domain-containing protein [Aquamicrobium sp.]